MATVNAVRLGVGLVLALFCRAAGADPAADYQQHCASCHGPDRYGVMGPALLPESLERLRKAEAVKVITAGRPATQMQGFADRLAPDAIEALAQWIYAPVSPPPDWSEAQIVASRVVHHAPGTLPDRPQYAADPMNLFIVVEQGDQHVSILDGDRLEPIHRFPSRYGLHGGPKFSPDGRYVYFASRDGWVSKFDLWNLATVAEVRVALNTRNLAVSADGRHVLVANYLPRTLVLLDADLGLERVYPAADLEGRTSRVSAVYDAAPRRSFVVAMKDIPELWEISYDPDAEPIHDGFVHDYKMGEGLAQPGYLNPRRTRLDAVLDDFFFDPSYRNVIGASRAAARGQVVNLDVRRKIADLDLPGMPHLASGITWEVDGRPVMATPNISEGTLTVIDMTDWKVVKQIPTLGPGFFLRSHERTPYAWVDSMMGPHKDTLQVIDKASLEVVARLTAEPGRTLAHVEFTRDGRYALASLWEMDGALVVYDAATLEEVKRIPMRKPVGKYNLHNKLTRSAGTSH